MRKVEIQLTGSKLVVMSVNDVFARQMLQITVRQEAVNSQGEPLINAFNDILTVTDSVASLQRSVGDRSGGQPTQPTSTAVTGLYTSFSGSQAGIISLVEAYVKPLYV